MEKIDVTVSGLKAGESIEYKVKRRGYTNENVMLSLAERRSQKDGFAIGIADETGKFTFSIGQDQLGQHKTGTYDVTVKTSQETLSDSFQIGGSSPKPISAYKLILGGGVVRNGERYFVADDIRTFSINRPVINVSGLAPYDVYYFTITKTSGPGVVNSGIPLIGDTNSIGKSSFDIDTQTLGYSVFRDEDEATLVGDYEVKIESTQGTLNDSFKVVATSDDIPAEGEEPPAQEPPADKPSAPKPPAEQLSAPKPPAEQLSAPKPPAQEPPADQPAAPEPPADQPSEKSDELSLTLSQPELTPADFVNKDKGVVLTVTGLKPNEKFQYSVSKQTGKDIPNLFKEVQADANGKWSYTVFGNAASKDLSGFVGEYKVTVKTSAGVKTSTFTVTNTPGKKADTPKAGGTQKTGDTTKSNTTSATKKSATTSLPRTGAELTGLVAGGALLAVGAVTVLVTRRRYNK